MPRLPRGLASVKSSRPLHTSGPCGLRWGCMGYTRPPEVQGLGEEDLRLIPHVLGHLEPEAHIAGLHVHSRVSIWLIEGWRLP